jgi:hypothetical protein
MEQNYHPAKQDIPWGHELSYSNQCYMADDNVQSATSKPYQATNPAPGPKSTFHVSTWSKKKKLIIFGGSAVIVVALIIGVAVGVTQSNKVSYCSMNPEAASCGGCMGIANGEYC